MPRLRKSYPCHGNEADSSLDTPRRVTRSRQSSRQQRRPPGSPRWGGGAVLLAYAAVAVPVAIAASLRRDLR